MRAEDVPQQWRTLMIGAVHEALDDNMLAAHYAAIERMVDEGLAAVAPMIAEAERKRCAALLETIADRIEPPTAKRVNQVDRHTAGVLRDKAAAIRALGDADE